MGIHEKTRRVYYDRIINIIIIAAILLFSIKCISVAITDAFSFDGAMNVQVAQNLAYNLNYATSFNGIEEFNPNIQTGITVLLPVAILFKLFGESFVSGLMVNAIYMIALLLAIVYYIKYCLQANSYIVLLIVLIIYGTPLIFEDGFGLVGEIPALFYFILSLILLHKYYLTSNIVELVYSGICIGLGYLTKTVILISLPAFIAVATYDYLTNNNKLHCLWKYVCFAIGIAAPALLFEIFKLSTLGIRSYYHWWRDQINAIMMQAGFKKGYQDTNGIIDKIKVHFGLLSTYLNIDKIILDIIIVLLLLLTIAIIAYCIKIYIKKDKNNQTKIKSVSIELYVLLLTAITYLLWWLIITPTEKAWYRRIIDGVILSEMCMTVVIMYSCEIISKLTERTNANKILLNILYIIIIILTAINVINSKSNYEISFTDTDIKNSSLMAGEFVKDLPKDSKIFGYGWWQAPIISFTSGKKFYDISEGEDMKRTGKLSDKYLVMDSFEYYTDKKTLIEYMKNYNYILIYEKDNIYIYQLTEYLGK